MPRYLITSDKTELPKGSRIYVIPVAEAQPNQLVMFGTTAGFRAGIGRWMPDVGGRNWILQPGRLIAETDDCRFIIEGVVVNVEAPPKEITNLTTSEYITALLYAREVKG
jgi:hypothetical protein